MNDTELARVMLEWSDLMEQASALTDVITREVMAREKTVQTGGVVAKYRAAAKVYDYEGTALHYKAGQEVVEDNTLISTDWEAVCMDADVDIPDAVVERHSASSTNWRGVCIDMGLRGEKVFSKPSGKEPTVSLVLTQT